MEGVRWIFWLHVILVPPGALIIYRDWTHPELWGDWFCNPKYAIPYLVVAEIFLWSMAAYLWLRDRKEKRMAEGMRLMAQAVRLLDEGRIAEADEIYRKGKELTNI